MLSITIVWFIFNGYLTSAMAQDTTPQHVLNLAQKNYQNHGFDHSKEHIKNLLETYPNNKNLLYNLGIIEYQKNNIDMAIGFLTTAHLRGNKNAREVLKIIQNARSLEIYNKNFKDKIMGLPLNLFLLIAVLFLILLLNRTINFYHRTFKFGASIKNFKFSWMIAIALLCIIFIKIKKDRELWAVSIKQIPLYAASNEKSAPIIQVTPGTKVIIKKTNGPWNSVKVHNRQGFILKKDLFYPEKSLMEDL